MSATQNISDETVYDHIEALLARDLSRQGRIELVQALEGVAALLSPAHSECRQSDRSQSDRSQSEFPDSALRAFPMGCEPAAH